MKLFEFLIWQLAVIFALSFVVYMFFDNNKKISLIIPLIVADSFVLFFATLLCWMSASCLFALPIISFFGFITTIVSLIILIKNNIDYVKKHW